MTVLKLYKMLLTEQWKDDDEKEFDLVCYDRLGYFPSWGLMEVQ